MYWIIAIALCFLIPVVGAVMLFLGLAFNVAVNVYDYWYNNVRRAPEPEYRYEYR